jgi:MoaA/NifB/PqqE/SkfB family radical SAM enzyme
MRSETLTNPARFKKRLRQKANMPVKYLSYELELEKAPTFPDRVYVESTNVCNLDCIMCPTGLHIDTRPKGYIEWDLYCSIVDEIAPFAEAVVLHSWGEPLLHKRIMDMIAYAKERDVWVETSTNAMLLSEEVGLKLIEAGLDRVYLSMDGLTKETYEKVRKGGNFERVLGNIERFLEMKHELGSSIEADIQIVRLSETDAEVDEFVRRWSESRADLINIKELDTWGGQIDEVSSLAVEDSERRSSPA